MTQPPSPDARARLPQPHGGVILSPHPHGSSPSSIMAARALGMRNLRKECRRLMAEAAVPNTERLLQLCLSDDERVSIIALKEYYDRFLGKIADTGLIAEEGQQSVNVDHLTPEQRRVVYEALMLLSGGAGSSP